MRILLKYNEDYTPYLIETLEVSLDDMLPTGDQLESNRTVMYITSTKNPDEATFVILPRQTAETLITELLEKGYLDLSQYMSVTFISYDRRDNRRLKNVIGDDLYE